MRPAGGGLGPARRRSGDPRRGSGHTPRRSGAHGGGFGAGWVGRSMLTWRWQPFPVDSNRLRPLPPSLWVDLMADARRPRPTPASVRQWRCHLSASSAVVPALHGVVRPPRGFVGGGAGVGRSCGGLPTRLQVYNIGPWSGAICLPAVWLPGKVVGIAGMSASPRPTGDWSQGRTLPHLSLLVNIVSCFSLSWRLLEGALLFSTLLMSPSSNARSAAVISPQGHAPSDCMLHC
jgi:hypothetical protein